MPIYDPETGKMNYPSLHPSKTWQVNPCGEIPKDRRPARRAKEENMIVKEVKLIDGATGLVVHLNGKVGWSICTPEDRYDYWQGVNIAKLRAEHGLKSSQHYANIPAQYYKSMIIAMAKLKG